MMEEETYVSVVQPMKLSQLPNMKMPKRRLQLKIIDEDDVPGQKKQSRSVESLMKADQKQPSKKKKGRQSPSSVE